MRDDKLKVDYFRRLLERVARDIALYTPDELARELARAAKTADADAALAALMAGGYVAVPREGWQLVPDGCTEEWAQEAALLAGCGQETARTWVGYALAAAPQPEEAP